jgi:hypothetical protein
MISSPVAVGCRTDPPLFWVHGEQSQGNQRNGKTMKNFPVAIMFLASAIIVATTPALSNCLRVPKSDPELVIDPAAIDAMSKAKFEAGELFSVMGIVSQYETGGCWAGTTGNPDGQWLSVGVMQWNFGQSSLQPLLKKFRDKFQSEADFSRERNRLMPQFGKDLFSQSCRTIPLGPNCKKFLENQYVGANQDLSPEFKSEVDNLFNALVMRQIQVDYFARNLTRILDDLNRVFGATEPAPWQVAWAMDLKTQQDRFPKDKSIIRIRKELSQETLDERKDRLNGIIEWYEGLCRSGSAEGVRLDCNYNRDTWHTQIENHYPESTREQAVHFTYLVSRTAENEEGQYQADAFQRRATIAFGKGSVHGFRIDFLK